MSKTGRAFNKWAEGPKNNMRFWRLNYRQSNCGGGNDVFPWGQGTVLAEPGKVPQKGLLSPRPSRCPLGLWGTPCCCSFTAAGFSSPKAAETFHLALGRWQLLQVYLATLVMAAWITVHVSCKTEDLDDWGWDVVIRITGFPKAPRKTKTNQMRNPLILLF